jgi:tetratricopeptide (TPR) repeat protein
VPREKEQQVRNRIMLQRLSRKYDDFYAIIKKISKPLLKDVSNFFSQLYYKILEIEKNQLHRQPPLKQIDINQQITSKFQEVQQLIADGENEKAEDICISIVELNPRNVQVYEILTDIYLERKEYKKAREVCKYLIKILAKGGDGVVGEKHRLANSYSNLGWTYQLENKYNFALTNYRKAVDLEPSNPRFLDLLLKISIILKNKDLATEVFNDLRQADPDNQKLAEIKEEIKNLPSKSEKVIPLSE